MAASPIARPIKYDATPSSLLAMVLIGHEYGKSISTQVLRRCDIEREKQT